MAFHLCKVTEPAPEALEHTGITPEDARKLPAGLCGGMVKPVALARGLHTRVRGATLSKTLSAQKWAPF